MLVTNIEEMSNVYCIFMNYFSSRLLEGEGFFLGGGGGRRLELLNDRSMSL